MERAEPNLSDFLGHAEPAGHGNIVFEGIALQARVACTNLGYKGVPVKTAYLGRNYHSVLR